MPLQLMAEQVAAINSALLSGQVLEGVSSTPTTVTEHNICKVNWN